MAIYPVHPVTTVTGELFETSVYSCLRKNINIETLYYWRTNKGQEIDFIITEGKRLIPIEVKSKFVPSGMSSLRYFLNAYPASKGLCVTLDSGIKWDNDRVKIVCPWRLLPYVSES